MSDIKLMQLNLKNFKGIKSFTLDAQGNDMSVFGCNRTGKTTLFDAFNYILNDKDSTNRADFNIKTLDATGEAIHNLDHEVEVALSIGGKALSLHKVFTEKWTKKRGQARAEFSGHTTSYFVNGVPSQEKEYKAQIAAIAPESTFRLLTDPFYFNKHMHWQERRRLILEVAGDISDQDVIASDNKLAQLPIVLGDHGMDDYRKIITAKRAKINEELKQIPVRIDEATRALPDISNITDPANLPVEIGRFKAVIRNKEDEIARIENGGEIIEKTKAIRIIEVEMLEILRKDRQGIEEQVQVKRKALNDAQSKIARMDADIRNNECSIRYRETQVADLEKAMGADRKAWAEIDAEQFTFEQATACPACGQSLPQERLDGARGKALAAFNLSKAQRLETNVTKGKAAKIEADRLNGEIADLRRQNDTLQSGLTVERDAVVALQQVIAHLETQSGNYTGGDAYTAKAAEKAHLEREIEALKAGNQDAISNIHSVIYGLTGSLSDLEDAQAKVRASEAGHKRIAELEVQEKKLAAEYERLEGELYLCDQFVRAKVNLLEERINRRFGMVRFKLFNVLINGGLEECCEATFGGVPWSDLNHEAQINTGLDIISTLITYFGFSAPVFVDNAEAVVDLLPIPAQMIRLVVSAADKALRVETEEAARVA